MLLQTGFSMYKMQTNTWGDCSYYINTVVMKIITLHNRINTNELFDLINHQLNPLFKEQRKSNIEFTIEMGNEAIDITHPELYPGDILYHIDVKGPELHITRSEHYVDDVNSLTIESILNDLFKDLSGKQGTDLVLEG
jgi:hypothetical protein